MFDIFYLKVQGVPEYMSGADLFTSYLRSQTLGQWLKELIKFNKHKTSTTGTAPKKGNLFSFIELYQNNHISITV